MLLVSAWVNYGGHIETDQTRTQSIMGQLATPEVLLTVAIFFLSNQSHGGYYGFFSLFSVGITGGAPFA